MSSLSEFQWSGFDIPVHTANTVIVGTGAAGLGCASHLFREMRDVGIAQPQDQMAIVTRGVGQGTSNNSGSDKQTYYKLGTADEPDCPADFAKTLTAGGCAHTDLAHIEGANSLRAFYRLADLGVPFPHSSVGTFIGYKTDHDPRQRGTSAGPWTSRFMVRALLSDVQQRQIPIFNRHHLVAVLTAESDNRRHVVGALCIDLNRSNETDPGLTLFSCRNLVVAGGGPGDLYAISVYPKGQMGPYAALFQAGATASNLSESQFGLASLKPRWNLSGTYQQVIPRYFSTNADGTDQQEFLNPWFDSMAQLASNIFLKGYQWPFDHDKIAGPGSSMIDILVHNEMIHRNRRVFIDFRENPRHTGNLKPFELDSLSPEALDYLQRSGATQPTPIQRLAHMNQPSIDLYQQMGVDLTSEPLEVGVCAQHCNGGFDVDTWWESNIDRLFVIGELAGTHGIKRPGGSALNAGQVGALRAAQRIAHVYHGQPDETSRFQSSATESLDRIAPLLEKSGQMDNSTPSAEDIRTSIQQRMSQSAGMVRSRDQLARALNEANDQWQQLLRNPPRPTRTHAFVELLETQELALAQRAFMTAILALLDKGSGSRGSHLVVSPEGALPHPDLDDAWRFLPENPDLRDEILTISYDHSSDTFTTASVSPRQAISTDNWFEQIWADYRRGRIFNSKPGDAPVPAAIYQKAK